MAAQILRHCRRSVVACVRVLRERFERNGIQIPAQRAPQRSQAHPSRLGRHLFDPLARSARLGRRRSVAEQPQRGGRLELVRSRTGEQLLEQHTQRVNVAAHIDRIAPQQLGAGVVGRERPTVETGQLPRRRIGVLAGQQFRDTKVQQPHLP